MKKAVNKYGKSEFLYGVFALLLMLLFMLCLASVTMFGIKKFMQPIKKDVVVDGFHWERAIKTDTTIASGDDQNPYWPEASISKNQNEDGTTINRLNSEELGHWLEDYTLGDLWKQNIMKGGQPR